MWLIPYMVVLDLLFRFSAISVIVLMLAVIGAEIMIYLLGVLVQALCAFIFVNGEI